MVRYLGKDYLKLAVQRKQEFLNKAFIAVPEHLEVIEKYTHQGGIEDARYREPWTRAHCDSEFLDDQKVVICDLPLPERTFGETVEKFESQIKEDELGFFDLDDFDSSDLFDETDNYHDDNITVSKDCASSALKKNEPSHNEVYQKNILTDELEGTIEEPLSTEFLSPRTNTLPSLKSLTQRLNKNQIKDPFSVEDLHNFRSICSLDAENPCPIAKPSQDYFKEEFLCVDLSEDEKLLEEVISPFTSQNKSTVLHSSLIKKELPEDVKPMEVVEQDEILVLLPECGHALEKEKLERETTDANYIDHFLEVNKSDDDQDIYKSLLDSPLVTESLKFEPENLNLSLLVETLSMFDLKQFNISRERILTVGEKESIENRNWHKEKYFDDILCMRLPEPDVQMSLIPHGSPLCEILQQENVKSDFTVGENELALNWDPVKNFQSFQMKTICVEKIDMVITKQRSFKMFEMEIEKYTTEMHEWQDEVIEASRKKCFSNAKSHQETSEIDDDQLDIIPVTKRTNETPTSLLEEDFGFNQIDDFFSLRTGLQCPKKIKSSRNEIQKDSARQVQQTNNMEDDFDSPVVSSEIITVPLGGKHLDILHLLEEKLNSFISVLMSNGVNIINHDLTTDYTRFLLKQSEKQMTDSPTNGTFQEMYKAAVCLHALTGAKDIFLHCCLESAIAHLQAAEDKYKATITGGLEDIRQKLFKCSCDFQQRKVYHPKLLATCKQIEKCLANSSSTKTILVILRRQHPSLIKTMEDAIGHCPNIKLRIGDGTSVEKLKASIEECKCLIMPMNFITKDFPWTKFAVAIDYEYDIPSNHAKICENNNLQYIGLTLKMNEEPVKEDKVALSVKLMKTEQEPGKIIGSSNVLSCGDMLHLLETRHNLIVIERDYSMFEKFVYFSDIDVDEKSCIILQTMSSLSDESNLEPFLKKVISLSLKYTKCWILLCNLSKSSKIYPYAGKYLSNLFKLQASIGNYVSRHSSFDAKVVACRSTEETCSEIRKICDIERESSSVWGKEGWSDDTWIKEKASKEENFLLPIPCLSSINCQIILSKMTLKELMTSSEENLLQTLSVIPERILKMMYTVIHSDQGLFSKLSSARNLHTCTSISDYSGQQVTKQYPETDVENTVDENTGAKRKSEYFGKREVTLAQPSFSRRFRDMPEKQHRQEQKEKEKLRCIDEHLCNPQTALRNMESREITSHHPCVDDIEDNSNLPEYEQEQDVCTQDTDDVLFLHDSQPSIIINEYERAEMEGNLNWRHKSDLDSVDDYNFDGEDWRGRVRYARVTPTRHHRISFDKQHEDLEQNRLNINLVSTHETAESNASGFIRPIDRGFISQERGVLNESQIDNTHKSSLNVKIPAQHYFGPTKHIEPNSAISSKCSYQEQTPTKNQLLVPDVETNKVEPIHSDIGNFSRSLSETTRNILQQAYKSPRFGVKPSRPLSQRISVGLAQPVRRQSASDIGHNQRETEIGVNGREKVVAVNAGRNLSADPKFDGYRGHPDDMYQDVRKGNIHLDPQLETMMNNRPNFQHSHVHKNENDRSKNNYDNYFDSHSKVREGFICQNPAVQNQFVHQNMLNGGGQNIQIQQTVMNDLALPYPRASHEVDKAPRYRGDNIGGFSTQTRGDNYYDESVYMTGRVSSENGCFSTQNRGDNSYRESMNRQGSVQIIPNQVSRRQWEEYDSPPMDLDYSPQILTQEYHGHRDMTNRLHLTSDKCVPAKKRRLGFVKKPGSKGGQTKLVFK